jgi:hypothetical protein
MLGFVPDNPVIVGNAGNGPNGLFDVFLVDSSLDPSVPDGRTTVMLLGSALPGLGLLRRFAISSRGRVAR